CDMNSSSWAGMFAGTFAECSRDRTTLMLNRTRLLLAVAVLIVLAMIAVIYRGIGFTTKEAAEKAQALIIAVMGFPSLLVSVKGFLTKSPAAEEVVLAPAPRFG